jgi:hypothetical protein
MKGRILVSVLLVFGLSLSGLAQVQLGQDRFGKTRIQNKRFEWKFFASDNFEVHFYEGGERTARLAIDYLESEFPRITDVLGYPPGSKTRILLYNSISDLQQSNIGVTSSEMNHNGEIILRTSYVEIAFEGQYHTFRQQLIQKVARNIIFDALYSGNTSDFFEASFQLSLPEWFIDGLARFVARGWDDEMDDYARNYATQSHHKKLNRLQGEEAEILGQSVWNFIAIRYGIRNISNILNLTRIIRNEETSISNTLGIRFRRFNEDWLKFYESSAKVVTENSVAHDNDAILLKDARLSLAGRVKLSPDGSKIAYNTYHRGIYRVHIKDVSGGSAKEVFRGGLRVFEQEYTKEQPVFAWQSSEQLAIADRGKEGFTLFLVNHNGKQLEKIPLPQFTHVNDFSFAPDGRRMAISATVNGQNDLFIFIPSGNFLRRITNDLFDVSNPRFIPGSNTIVFSSNRTSDTLQVRVQSIKDVGENFSLYAFNTDTTEGILARLTSTLSNDLKALPISANSILYTSDQRGIRNIFNYRPEFGDFIQVSNFPTGVSTYDFNQRNSTLAYISRNNNRHAVYIKNTTLTETFFPDLTLRQQTIQALMIAERRVQMAQDPIAQINRDSIRKAESQLLMSKAREGEVIIDTENYVFDIQESRTAQRQTIERNLLGNIRERAGARSRIIGPLPFEERFAIDQFQMDWRVDPLRGFGIAPTVQLSDVLENHTFKGTVFTGLDFNRGGEIMTRYEYRKLKPDFSAQYLRRSFTMNDSEVSHRYQMDQAELMVSYPINSFAHFRVGPTLTHTRYLDLDPRLLTPNLPPGLPPTQSTDLYFGGKAELVFDNSVIRTVNITSGTKAKASVAYFDHNSSSNNSFGKIRVDARHYQPISQNLILAMRANYGRFFGADPKRFLVGGSENWVFNRIRDTDGDGTNDPLDLVPFRDQSALLFHEFVPTVRGFDFNFFNGTDFLSFNAEIRFPVLSYLHRGPIASNFLRNFQLVGFYDIGSAWSDGKSPFTEQSSQNIEIVRPTGSPFSAVINNFGNPWLQSVGMGARTVLMGYFVRFDLAYPIEAYRTPSSRFLISLGYDF